MKVCIVAFANLMVTPYIRKYSDICEANGLEYDIIYWNRHNIDEGFEGCCRLYTYSKAMPDSTAIYKKFVHMLNYARYVKRILKKNKYDRVVVLTSLLGVLLERYLVGHMKKSYVFDIRDHSYEHIKWYYNKMVSLLNNSKLNVISSIGFKNFLPECDSRVLHNCGYSSEGDNLFKKKSDKPLKISFIGLVRYEDECKKFIDAIANDKRLEFHFWGRGDAESSLKKYCVDNDVKNVMFHGEYKPEQKNFINNGTDMIYNAYGDNLHVKYALSNKYYDAMYFKKPLVVNKNTSMAEMAEGVAFAVDYGENVADKLIQWYDSIDEEKFNALSGEYLMNALKENTQTEKWIGNALSART